MNVLIFHNVNGVELDDVYLADSLHDKNQASLLYLTNLGSFACDDKTKDLQIRVKNNNLHNLWIDFSELIQGGYDCFYLSEPGFTFHDVQ